MSSTKRKECACKGIRTCLQCESLSNRSNSNQNIEENCPIERLYYCGQCEACYPGHVWQSCADHAHILEKGLSLKGITIIPDFVNEEEETQLLDTVNQTPWKDSQSGRRKQDYGPKVNFKKKKIQCSVFTGLPSFSKYLVERMHKQQVLEDFLPVELCNLEYDPSRGAAIDPHYDDFWLWGDRLVTLNLLSDTFYTMTLPEKPKLECAILLKRRDLIVLDGDARTKFMHAIRREDIKTKRVGITLRELSKEFSQGGEREELGMKVIETALGFQGIAVGNAEKNNDKESGKSYTNNTTISSGISSNDKVDNNSVSPATEHHNYTSSKPQNGHLEPGEKEQARGCDKTHQEKMERDGFQQVTRKKAARIRKKNAANVDFGKMIQQTLSSCPDSLCVDEVIVKIQKYVDELRTDGYAQTFCQAVIPADAAIQRVVGYGIGSFSTCYKARYQLAMLLVLVDTLKVDRERCLVYDPVWNEMELQCLKQLGMNVLMKDERGCRLVSVPTLFYLPHCPRHLTNNLLWSNWTADRLPYLHIVSNNLQEVDNLPKHIIIEDSSYILKILPYTLSHDVPNMFHADDVFNNMAANTFPYSSLTNAPQELWEDHEAPVYTDTTDIDFNVVSPVPDQENS